VHATDFPSTEVKEGKQAESLMPGAFPVDLIERIGVLSDGVAQLVSAALQGAPSRPTIEIRRDWYY